MKPDPTYLGEPTRASLRNRGFRRPPHPIPKLDVASSIRVARSLPEKVEDDPLWSISITLLRWTSGGAHLADSDANGAKLANANLDGAIFCNTLMPDATVRSPTDGACPDL